MRRLLLILAAVSACLLSCAAASAATLPATPVTFTAVYSGAKGGDTVTLATGAYPTFKGAAKASRVTIKPADGATVTMAGAQFVGTSNITIQGVKFTSGVVLRDSAHDIVLDGDTFDKLGPATWEGRLSFNLGAHDNTVRNSHFGNGGCSDGVFVGDAPGNTIGPGNEFSGIVQGSCAAHSDAIQLYDGPRTAIVGNYFHDNSTGIMAPNGTNDATLIDNVFVMAEYPYAAYLGWAQNTTAIHNTIVGGSLHFEDWTGSDHPSAHTSGTVRDNVLAGGIDKVKIPAGALDQDYNLLPTGAAGAHDQAGAPNFQGGARPASYAGFALAAGSLGSGDASDGGDLGIRTATTPPLPVDTDHDGIPDSTDACPTVPGAQADGCPVPTPPPVDPCDQSKAERDQALADLAAMTDSRDAWKARALKAEDQVARIKVITGE